MDWNWFFSSMAQSAAAIVGILGAFIITKVLTNQAQFSEKCLRFRSLRTAASKLVDSADHLAFAWYVRLNRKSQLEKAEELLAEDDNLVPDELYAKLQFPPFLARADAIQDLQDLKSRREVDAQRMAEVARRHAEAKEFYGQFGMGSVIGVDGGTRDFLTQEMTAVSRPLSGSSMELSKERSAIDAVEVEIRHHMRTITDFLATTASNPESSVAITWALVMVAALFLIGVVYPLSFLPTPSSGTPTVGLSGFWVRVFSLRGFLLTAVSGIFLAALTMFAVMNRRLRYWPEQIQSLKEFTFVGKYSKYYAIAENNEKIAREMAPTE